MSAINVTLKRNNHETGVSLVRRFSRKMQEAGIIPAVKSKRYHTRPVSKLAQKNMRIKSLIRRAEVERLKKLGKM
ncbi:MAG TPA: 30S ribosomal protein S21 [Candidatus Paceibacterota bacterium]|nr:30S ribosomal protein S21 [Candidatus Paceibacterota bacterium]